ncbi:MAG: ATP-binding cassette domain-containing protein [Sphaerochaetaceae bacterium]|jgi:oligopeptide transport system ATP-binding protein|nr:ATP-binding cassette domain-containing protein [Sphaerochaetaceae bacterium]MDD2406217.1 ATP-binding cassette domain-containing protein [Sphaerochaetaceae bacterium]MDD4258880.1 ATP-binding cassette domain-containing protein [Sphaerochaetaceae bacterium]MDD4841383.1 ATP-binding cassette domain-containing protein [Sphaerochaetaceae bacterium]NLO60462.1 ATP-binding cassette domain-containing protein [Spirochaetales bacterium]
MAEATTTRQPLLTVTDLKQHFPIESGFILKRQIGAVRAVDGISFSVYPGETLGIVGESGCGKSTTIRSIAQLYKPTAGKVMFNGLDLVNASKDELLKARKDIQLIFQDPYASLNPRMTVRQIISEPLTIYSNRKMLQPEMTKEEIETRIEELMERVGLNKAFKNRYPHEFSGGQRQRIGIARALALNPKIILADEPVSALDVSIQSQILNLLNDLQKDLGLTYLFIAHDLAVIEYISTRVAVMYLGIIVELSESRDLYHNPLHPYTKALLSAAPIPDPAIERKRKRIILTGDVPSPIKEHKGCYFYERCPMRMEHCATNIPPLHQVSEGHEVACWLYE